MKKLKRILLLVFLTTVILAACSSNQLVENQREGPIDESASDQNAITSESEPMEEAAEMDETSEEELVEPTQSNKPDWYFYEFTDAVTGESFSINSLNLNGNVVLVGTMMIQCQECLAQQEEIKELHSLLGDRNDFENVVINVSPEEDLLMTKLWADHNEFDWLNSDAPPEIISDIAGSLGSEFLNPSEMPMVLFDKNGNAYLLPSGIKSAEFILTTIETYLD